MFLKAAASGHGPAALAVAGLLATSSPASTQINIPFNYGNEAGCRNLATGDYDDDSMVYLTPGGFSTYATGCEIVQALRPKNDSYVVTAVCSHEGEETKTLEMYRIERSADGADAYEIYNDEGDLWQRVEPCL